MNGWIALVNPFAGGGRALGIWHELRASEPRLAVAEMVDAPSREAVGAELARRLAAGAGGIVVLGGDGSVQLAADAILAAGAGERTRLAIVPTGTGSDLARNLGISRRPEVAARTALDGRERRIDAFRLTAADGRVRHVVNAFSAGISGLVGPAVARMRVKGRTGYLRATLAALLRYRSIALRVTADGEPWHDGPLFLLAAANSTSFGNGMKIAPGAELDDGEMDLVKVGDLPRWQVPLRLPQIYLGTHLGSRWVESRRARRLAVEPLEEVPPFDLDGEVFAPAAPVELEVLPGALAVKVP